AGPPAAAENLRQPVGQVPRPDVLEVVAVQPHAGTGGIDPLQPLAHVVQVFGLGGDHHHRVGALDRHEAEHPGDGRLALVAEDRLQVLHHALGAAGFQREHADRHAGQPVDVEHLDGAQVVLQLAAAATDADHVAGVVGADDRVRARVGLEDLAHFLGRDVAQRHGAYLEAARPDGTAGTRRDVAGKRLPGRDDVVAAVAVDQPCVVPGQHLLQQADRLGGTDRPGGGQGHRALDIGRDDVVLPQHV